MASEDLSPEHRLKQTLSWPHLIALGVGAIVGTGILTLIGVGADKAGPAVTLSFVVAGLVCACAALAYAEMATMIPAAGGAYTYSYVVLGELVDWIVGWSLILEYSLVVSAVAVGWLDVPMKLMQGPDGVERGVMAAAAIIFFAFYGFDAIATAAEETRNPSRDLSIGIVGSMLACVAIYIAVAAVALGALAFNRFANSPEPLALILRELGQPGTARYLAGFAVVALPTVILGFFYGQSRIFFAMTRDGLLPRSRAEVSPRGTPASTTLFTVVIVGTIAGFFPLADIAALPNAGTLAAFIAVAVCMLIMRQREPSTPLKFKAPLPWVVGPIAIVGCLYLFISLPQKTQLYFLIWNTIGLVGYLAYGSRQGIAAESEK